MLYQKTGEKKDEKTIYKDKNVYIIYCNKYKLGYTTCDKEAEIICGGDDKLHWKSVIKCPSNTRGLVEVSPCDFM